MSDNAIALLVFSFGLFLLGFATNFYRERRSYRINLKPNCLLTRHPLVFVTGPRSIFYFKKYWNAYPEILTEHGYEVFTLHLPWSGPARGTFLQNFLDEQNGLQKKFHFILDEITQKELSKYFEHSPVATSLTLFKSSNQQSTPSKNIFLSAGYRLHSLRFINKTLPTPDDLGVHFPIAASPLLKQMQKLAEQDFLT